MRLVLERSTANQESDQQLKHNEDLELKNHDNSIENPNIEEGNISLSQYND